MKVLASIARIALAVVVALPLVLYFSQDRLIFQLQPMNEAGLAMIKKALPQAKEIWITAADGTRLHGWLAPAKGTGRAPSLIYFGGNAENVSGALLDAPAVPAVAFFAMNYRGYGLSEGKPSEAALFADALAIYDHVVARPDVDPAQIIVLGRSLGSGVATYLAANRPVRGVILVTPYDSVTAVAERKYPFMPIRWLLKHPFDSQSRAPGIKAPALILAAGDDTLIPPVHAERLLASWGGPRRIVTLRGVDHDTVDGHADYWPQIRSHLLQIGVAVQAPR